MRMLIGCCILEFARIEAEILNRLPDSYSVGIFQSEHCRIESSGNGPAADEGKSEADALFL